MAESVLVTGAAGYLGARIARALAGAGIPTYAVYRGPTPPEASRNLQPVACRLDRAGEVLDMLHRTAPSCIVHAAAWISRGDPGSHAASALADNIQATANLVAAALQLAIPKFVFCSSGEVYAAEPLNRITHQESDPPAPQSLYGRSKLAAELSVELMANTATASIVVRMPGIHGLPRRSGFLFNCISTAIRGAPITLDEPDTALSFLMLDDATRAITHLASTSDRSASGTLNLASGTKTLRAMAETVKRICSSSSELIIREGRARNRGLDTSKAARILPISFDLERAIELELERHRSA